MSGLGLRAGDGFVLRTPALPETFPEWAAAADPSAYLATLVGSPEVREAIYVASPSLHDGLDTWLRAPRSAAGQRVERAIVKYVARMMGRATPFGLFSAVSTGRLGRATDLVLAPRAEYRRRTRLDNDYLFVLADRLAAVPEARARLAYRPSSSIYRVADQLRYAAARIDGKARVYELVSIEPTPYLDATLARAANGATRDVLAAALVARGGGGGGDGDRDGRGDGDGDGDGGVDEAQARAYIDELIDAQVLVPELGVFVTGPEPLDGLIEALRVIALDEPRAVLEDVRRMIAELDTSGPGADPARYEAIAARLAPLPAPVERARLFQVDMVKPAAATLAARVAADVARTIEKLARLGARDEGRLGEWKRAFRDRYEDRTVPLAEVLDEDTGIGFERASTPGAEGAPLLAGLALGGRAPDERVRWTARDQVLLAKLTRALAAGDAEISIDDADLAAMAAATPAPLAQALSAIVRIAGRDGSEPTILVESAGGPSGARLLGRFAHASAEIDAITRAHLALEEAARPAARFAEIVHLAEGRLGNILCRPVLRGHEIAYLGQSGAPRDAQLELADLLVTVRGDRVVVTSRRLGCEIVPRLTTAHNVARGTLGVYRFLAELASQDGGGAGWSWGALARSARLPRVRIGKVIVSRARWTLEGVELAPITAAVRAGGDVAGAVAELRRARGLPRMLAVVAFDNELPIDLENPLLVAAFADEVSGTSQVQLVEWFPAGEELAVRGPEGRYANEIILTFTRAAEPARPAVARAPAPATARRTFAPGSAWLYAKIYAGEAAADRVLAQAVGPVARAALADGDADRWFFLRYSDPEPHVRVRFHGEPAALTGRVLPALERAVAPLCEAGVARKLVLDTYEREIERYGGDRGIELVEQLFCVDSEAVLAIVELLEGAEGATARWQLALRGIDSLLEALGLDAAARAALAVEARDRLGTEVGATAALWRQLGERFARDEASLDVVFARDPARDAAHDFEPGFAILARRDEALAPIVAELRRRDAAGELAPRVADLAWSVAHMHANRLLHASQRAQEMVLYEYLRRLHARYRARHGNSSRAAERDDGGGV